ncbi:hemolysin family protein [Salibacterium aidingense]|uniref:hemolysin family protein n=1 Tax=Salibacterium aidingense TaxID=384933 RepID=UPI0003FBB3F7|nr:CNNM domain-containing protein [Salibacterium aidingense]
MLAAIIFLLCVSLFLSGSETALTAVNKMKVQSRAENGEASSKKLLHMISHPDELITAILIGNNISNIMLPTLVTIAALDYGVNVGLATAVLTVVIIVFSEVLPKSIAATFADKIAYLVAPVIRFIMTIFKPLTALLSLFTGAVIRVISKGQKEQISFSKEELKTMVDIGSSEGTFETEETQRIKGVIDFYNKDVKDALKTPRMDIVGIPAESSYKEAEAIILKHNHTRYPVYDGNMDHIIGVFHSKLLLQWANAPGKSLSDFTDNYPLYIVETTNIEKVFKMMLKEKKHLAIVLDEYGGTTGIISHEDIIEAMIGQEIADETDEEEDVLIKELSEDHIVCHGKLGIRRLNDLFRSRIPEEEDIIAGFLYKEMEHIPGEGETLEYHSLFFEIIKMDKNRIEQVKIKKLPE